MLSSRSLFLPIAVCALIASSINAHSEAKNSANEHLKFVLVLSRHGVRSPTWTNDRLNEYSKSPWPTWDVAPGLLTPHGKKLMTEFGTYYRQWFSSRGLLQADGCAETDQVYIDTDSDERTIETGHGLADGLFPGCALAVHSLEQGHQDVLFHSAGKLGKPSVELASSALAGRIGGDPDALKAAYQPQLYKMRGLLFGCESPSCSLDGKKDLSTVSSELAPGKGDHLAEAKGPLFTAATFAENLQLEYLEGMSGTQLGWGQVDQRKIQDFMSLHAATSDLVQRTPYIARVQASNLLGKISFTIQQAEQQHSVPGAIGTPEDRVVFLVGHDTNIANVAALLDAHWLVDGYQRDDAAPGGALVFELWQTVAGVDELRTYYVVQTPSQMHDSSPLSLAVPPKVAPIFLPGCSQARKGFPCAWPDFTHLIDSVIDRSFIQ